MNKIRIRPLATVAILLLAIDFAALDDITTGNEPDYWAEWDFLLFSTIIFGLMIYARFSKSKT